MEILPGRHGSISIFYDEVMQRHRFLICYDIREPKRLRRVAKVCESYGRRLQFSVFETVLSSVMLAQLKAELETVVNHTSDQILYIDLGRDNESMPFHIETTGLPYARQSRVTII